MNIFIFFKSISIQIYSDITLLLIIINCNKIRPVWESNSIVYEFRERYSKQASISPIEHIEHWVEKYIDIIISLASLKTIL